MPGADAGPARSMAPGDRGLYQGPVGRYGDGVRRGWPSTIATFESVYRHMDQLGIASSSLLSMKFTTLAWTCDDTPR